MGCNDSRSMRKSLAFGDKQKTAKNSNLSSKYDKILSLQSQRKSRLTPLYLELQDMYSSSGRDLDIFIRMIEERVAEMYFQISRQTLTNMNHDEIAAEQSKIIISEEILYLNLNILKVIGKNNKFNYDSKTFQLLNKFQNHLIGYLKTKYPRGQQTFVSGDLMAVFKEFDRVNDIEYDILKNSNTYFGEPDDKKIINGIKSLINKVIKQCDKHFAEFQTLIQQKAFFIQNQNKQKVSLSYKIGRKIPQSAPRYESFDTDVLQISSPQVFRVLIKWMQDLEDIITNTSQKISKHQSFKCFIKKEEVKKIVVDTQPNKKPKNKNQKQPIADQVNANAEKRENKLVFDYINQYEYNIVNKLIQRIQNLKPFLKQKNDSFIHQLNNFNEELLKILNHANPHQKYVPAKEIETIKYSSFNAKFVEYILAEKLVYAIKQLIKVGKTFISENMMNLDLIRFKLTDLMRCQVSGNKKQILQVYDNFKKLQKQGQIQIIKIKNRLATPLNDAMIIFKISGCWIICQAQLILSQAGEKIDKKSKNIELVNHYFYELERSPYGIMAEIAVLLTYKDSKMSYENKITFYEGEVNIEKCRVSHPDKITQNEQQVTPFICSKCSVFYSKYQNLFKYYKCEKCNTTVCSKCILKKNPELQTSLVMRDIQRALQQKIEQGQKFSNKNKQFSGGQDLKQSKSTKEANKKLTPKIILNSFISQRLKLQEKFPKNKGKISGQKLMDTLNSMYQINDKSNCRYFIVVNFSKGQADFKLYSYDPKQRAIENTADSGQSYDQSSNSNFKFSQFDLLFMMKPDDQQHQNAAPKKYKGYIDQNYLFIFVSKRQFQAKIQLIKAQSEQKNKESKKHIDYQIISKRLSNQNELILDFKEIKKEKKKSKQQAIDIQHQSQYDKQEIQQKKQFRYSSLNALIKKLPDLKMARTTLQFDNLGVETVHLQFFKNIEWKNDIKQLKLTNNKISDLKLIVQNLDCLQRFYFNDNYVKQLSFSKIMKNLQILNGSRNQMVKIDGLNNLPRIRKFLLNQNKLTKFPKCNLPQLNVLNLKKNMIPSIQSILQSSLPQLQQLIINEQQGCQQQVKRDKQQSSSRVSLQQYQRDDDDFQQQQILSQASSQGGFFSFWKTQKPKQQKRSRQQNVTKLSSQQSQKRGIFNNIFGQSKLKINNRQLKNLQCQNNSKFFSGKELCFDQSNLQKISLRKCNLKSITFQRKQSLQSLKFIHLAGNQIKYFIFLNTITKAVSKLKQKRSINNDQFATLTDDPNQSTLPKSIVMNDNLVELNLNENVIETIPIMKFSSLKKLSLYDNKITDIKLLQKSKMPELEYLNLGHNAFTVLQQLTFNKLKTLNLQEIQTLTNVNQLFVNSSLADLERIDFKGCRHIDFTFTLPKNNNTMTNLKQLNFNNVVFTEKRKAKDPPFHAPNLEKLTFEECVFKYFPLMYLPKLTSFKLNNAKAKSFKHLEEGQYFNLQTLQIINCEEGMNFIEEGITTELNDTSKLLNCAFDPQRFPSLKSLYIKDSTIGSLKGLQKMGSVYQKLQTLKLINVYRKTKSNPNNLSKPCCAVPSIKAPMLTECKIKGCTMSDGDDLLGYGFENLVTLQLQQNGIQKIGDNKLSKLQSIKTMSIINNKLRKFVCSKRLDKLMTLNLSDNKLVSFPRIKAKNLADFRWDNNQFNDISQLQHCDLPALDQIQIIGGDLRGCQFPKLNMPFLDKLTISNARLQRILHIKQSNLPKLTQLNLSNNQITQIPPQLKLKQLTSLDLSYNKLMDIQFLNDKNFQKLNTLKLSENPFGQIPKSLQLSRLKVFVCHNMKMRSLPNLSFNELQKIHMQNCQIQSIDEFVKGQYSSLVYLNLSNNKLVELPKVMMDSLRVIIFDNNRLENIDTFLMQSNIPEQQVQSVSFCNNQLQQISNFPYVNMEQLRLSNNPLVAFDCLQEEAYPYLKLIDLSETKVNTVQNLPNLPELETLMFNKGQLTDIDWLVKLNLKIPNLYKFNGRKCHISSLPCFDLNLNLKRLILRGNPIKKVKQFMESKNLKSIEQIKIDLQIDGKEYEQIKKKITKMNGQANIRSKSQTFDVQDSDYDY